MNFSSIEYIERKVQKAKSSNCKFKMSSLIVGLSISISKDYLLIIYEEEGKCWTERFVTLFKNNSQLEEIEIEFDFADVTVDSQFMNTSDNFMIWNHSALYIYQISNERCQVLQTLGFEVYALFNLALSQDDKTLYHYCLENSQIIACNLWQDDDFILYDVGNEYEFDINFCISESGSFLLFYLRLTLIILKQVKTNSWLMMNKLNVGNRNPVGLMLIQDNLISAHHFIIQWNKWTGKIIRKQLPCEKKWKNILKYSNGLIFRSDYEDITCCRYINGKLETIQIFSGKGDCNLYVSSDGLLLIILEENQLIFYEKQEINQQYKIL